MSNFVDNTGEKLFWQVGLETDIGGGRENQDDCFVWIKRDDNIIVLCVLDGHGREVGKIASESAKMCLFKHLDENYTSLLQSPSNFLVNAHNIAHEHIRESFRTELQRQGYEVFTTDQGYLMKRRLATDNWACVHGGTSCSILAVVRGELFIANVGDSTGILCSSFGVLANTDLGYLHDAAVAPEINRQAMSAQEHQQQQQQLSAAVPTAAAAPMSGSSSSSSGKNSPVRQENIDKNKTDEDDNISGASTGKVNSSTSPVKSNSSGSNNNNNNSSNNNKNSSDGNGSSTSSSTMSDILVLTAEHSPECPYEYARLLRFREREGNPLLPALVVVYDSSSNDKTRCAPVFERDSAGVPRVTGKGSYYKNVRREWASLVSTPPYAQFQDALAFTRSLGDLHLHTYGVTHLPEVQRIDLHEVFNRLEERAAAESTAEGGQPNNAPASSDCLSADAVARSTLCLVLATDGVWDNWSYEDVGRFVMDASCLGAVGSGTDGAKRVTISFMQRNALYAKRNFGNNADNATGIVLYISRSTNFPAV
mmetsp:Transcript_119503/g.234876  ORF Transcript_119503/g.234876 Transcript_119503/m.234876 type:complete len:537 (+) Transcript_119503:244-1854(+)